MDKIKFWGGVERSLAVAGLVLMLLSFLALADIYHGEADVHNEWAILYLTFFVVLFLFVATFILTAVAFKRLGGNNGGKIWPMVTATLGFAGLVFMSVAILALAGIRGGGAGPASEWALLRLAYFVTFVLIIAIAVSAGLMAKYFRDRGAEKDRPSPGRPGQPE